MVQETSSLAVDAGHGLLHCGDEDALARLLVQRAREDLRFSAVAVVFRSEAGRFEVRARAGFSPEQDRILSRASLTLPDIASLRAAARWLGPVGHAAGSHVLWGLGSLVFVILWDADGVESGLILLGNLPRGRLPRHEVRVALELLGQAASVALEGLRERRAREARIRTIETQKRQLEALLQASANVHGVNLDQVLQRIAESMTADGGFRRAAVYLRSQDDLLCARAFVGVPPEDVERIRVPVPFSMFAHLMRPEMQISRSFLFDHRKHELPSELLDSLSLPKDRPCGPDEWHPLDSLSIPLQDRSGRTIGLISMDEPCDRRYPDLAKIQVLELFAGACTVAVEQARLYDEIQRLAMTDPLTELDNRRSFEEGMRRELVRGQTHGTSCCLLFCDVDGLKQLNDTHGHETGDRALQAIAGVLRTRLREGDLAARVGGDEFVALLPDTDAEQGTRIARELREIVASVGPPAIPAGIRLSISVGVAEASQACPLSQPELLQAADRALYRAKLAGRNRVQIA